MWKDTFTSIAHENQHEFITKLNELCSEIKLENDLKQLAEYLLTGFMPKMANIEQMELDSETPDEEEHQSRATDELDESLEDDEFEYVIVEKKPTASTLTKIDFVFSKGSGLEMQTMLSIIAWNSIQDAELQGRRKELTRYQYFSKAKDDVGEKNKKTGGAEFDGWKRELILRVKAKKIEYGPGDPPVHALDEFEDDDETDQLAHIFDEIVNFDDFYEDFVDDE
uniref:Uncharacterized protein n=1 Tax=Acrobeloides nanus TaxID=290746 RepID=A0A914CD79_9BILA